LGRIVGLDYGEVRIGISLSNDRKSIALPQGYVLAKKNIEETAQMLSVELAKLPQLDLIVIGLPLLLNGKDSPLCIKIRQLALLLESMMTLPVVLWDERLTTALVERSLKELNVNRKKRTHIIDALAATSILQNYIDAQ
jgi:putative holliday junction resolvase